MPLTHNGLIYIGDYPECTVGDREAREQARDVMLERRGRELRDDEWFREREESEG